VLFGNCLMAGQGQAPALLAPGGCQPRGGGLACLLPPRPGPAQGPQGRP
jgi:hypothetical protein